MLRTYQWTTDDDEVAFDAIMVGVAGTSIDMLLAGLSYVEPQANIYWSMQVTSQGVFAAGQHMGWPVVEALDRAEELRAMMRLDRVVISLAERGIWRDEWGILAENEGYD